MPDIKPDSDHILLYKDENGWHPENYGPDNDRLIPVHGDLGDAIAEGQEWANAKCMQGREVWLVRIEFVHRFQPKR